jgi:putative peptide zinc metalloprotease protein
VIDVLFSPVWYRVSSLKLALRSHVELHRHNYREQNWYLLEDRSSGRNHRINNAAFHIVALLDGERTMQAVWDIVNARLGDDALTQDEVIQLLSRLYGADLLKTELPPNTSELFERLQREKAGRLKQRLGNPLALRFPLFDPDRLLDRLLPLARVLFSTWFGIIWLGAVVLAALLAVMHWPALMVTVREQALTPGNLVLLWLCYPFVKLLHEFGHGLAAKLEGGEVHEMGLMLLVLTPIPYVDASSANTFRSRYKRMLVGGAGIMVELFLASLALFLWLGSEPGLVNSLAFNVMLIGGVSTLLFNGNPLLRYDGYYVLSDALEIPNLATRANQYIGYLVQRRVLDIADARSPVTARGEAPWLFGYAIASFFYRLFVIVMIALMLAEKFHVVGVVFGLWALGGTLLVPIAKHLRFLFASEQLRRGRLHAVLVSGAGVLAALLLLGLLPMPSWTLAEGVVLPADDAQVRAEAAGFVSELLVAPDTRVQRGQALMRLDDPGPFAERAVLAARMDELKARYTATWLRDPVEANVVREEMSAVSADMARAGERIEALVIRSPADGQFLLSRSEDLPGMFIAQGELLGYIRGEDVQRARVVIAQQAAGMVAQNTRKIEIRLVNSPRQTWVGSFISAVPNASNRLPSKVLAAEGGGQVAVDPGDEKGLTALEPLFQFEVALPKDSPRAHIGARAYVKFQHEPRPLLVQWLRSLRQLFLKRFDI